MSSTTLDRTDWQILDELQNNARVPFEELSRKVALTPEDVAARVRRMEDEGVITEYRAVVNPRKAGHNLSALISVSVDGSAQDQIINDALTATPEVTACWSITGASDFLLEAHVPSLEFLEELLSDLSRYGRLTTSIVLPRYGRRGKIHPPRVSMTD